MLKNQPYFICFYSLVAKGCPSNLQEAAHLHWWRWSQSRREIQHSGKVPRAYTVGCGRLIQFIKTLVLVWPGVLFKAELAEISGLHGYVHKYPMMPPQVEDMLQTHDRLATCPRYTFPRIDSNPTATLKSRSRKEWVDEINLTFCLFYIWIFSVYDTVMLQKTHVTWTNAKKHWYLL